MDSELNQGSVEQVPVADASQKQKDRESATESFQSQAHVLTRCGQGPRSACVELGSGSTYAKDGEASAFSVRAVDFLRSKHKKSSLASFYELVRVEIIPASKSNSLHCHVAQNVSGLESGPTGPLPQHFVMNLQLPTGPPPVLFSSASNPSLSVVFYFRVREETQMMALSSSSDHALSLLTNYFRNAPKNRRLQEKMKLIGQVANFSELNIPNMFQSYNGKPVLITKSGSLHRGNGYLEMDVDVNCFCYMARAALHQLWQKVSEAQLEVAVLVQGDTEEELPERLLGCAILDHIELQRLLDSVG